MRTNGYIWGKTDTVPPRASVEFDIDGNPVVMPYTPGLPEWTDPVDCWIEINTDDAEGAYENGEFRRCALTVLIDDEGYTANIVKVERDGDELGEFRVMQRQILHTMGRTRLMLRQ